MTNATKRDFFWLQMDRLEANGLGPVTESDMGLRRNLLLDTGKPYAGRLSEDVHPDGFLRVEEASLLIRRPSQALIDAFPPCIQALRNTSKRAMKKGFQVNFGPMAEADILMVVHTIRTVAGLPGTEGQYAS